MLSLLMMGLLVGGPVGALAEATPLVDFNQTAGNTVNQIELTVPKAIDNSIVNETIEQPIVVNGVTITAPKSIRTAIGNLVKQDANIRKIEVKNGMVKVDYRQATKILGFIPARFNLHVVADPTQKRLNIGRSWWAMFSNTNVRQVFEKLKNGMNGMSTSVYRTTDQQSTQTIKIISTVMKSITKK